MKTIIDATGREVLSFATLLGEMYMMVRRTIYWFFRSKMDWRITLNQMLEMGAHTFPVTALTLLFTGMVLALQTGVSFIKVFNEPLYVGRIVGVSVVKELGPVLTALVFSGRVGAAIAAEIGTMKVTEQIDALYTLGTNPIKYLALPRFTAALLMLPILTILSNTIGIFGGFLVSNLRFNIPSNVYLDEIYALGVAELFHGLLKSFLFAFLIVMVSCYKGLSTSGGAEGVGRATTQAVVVSMVLVLVGDYFASALLVALGIG